GINTKGDVLITVDEVGSVAAESLNAIDAATSGLVSATSATAISGTAAALKTLVANIGTSGDKLDVAGTVALTISDSVTVAADLIALNAATTGLVDASNAASLTGNVLDVTNVLVTNRGASGDKISLRADVPVTLDEA